MKQVHKLPIANLVYLEVNRCILSKKTKEAKKNIRGVQDLTQPKPTYFLLDWFLIGLDRIGKIENLMWSDWFINLCVQSQ